MSNIEWNSLYKELIADGFLIEEFTIPPMPHCKRLWKMSKGGKTAKIEFSDNQWTKEVVIKTFEAALEING